MRYSLLAVSLMAIGGLAKGQRYQSEEAALTVCLMNDVGVPRTVEENVERRVDAMVEDAGIHIRWLHGEDPGRTAEVRCVCSHPEAMRVVIVRWIPRGKSAMPNELGQAFLGEDGVGAIADLFLDRIVRLTQERDVDFAHLLAHVTAHELGHLLLGANSHSAGGLMQARMNEDSLARLAQVDFRFSRKQVEKIRERMKAAGQAVSWWRNGVSCPDEGPTRIRVAQAEAM